ncbi:MAG: hypothetical protein U0610_17695 [bacterium]
MTGRRALLVLVALTPLALAARWSWYQDGKGAAFLPSPDSLEYAASAQSIAADGTFLLQIGPHRVRPRYSPGWPLVQTLALRAGADGARLWRFTAIFGALLASGIALATMTALECRRGDRETGCDGETERSRSAIAFGLGAGVLWCWSPLSASSGGTLMSDEPTALASFTALACATVAFLRAAPVERTRSGAASVGWALGAGFAAGLALTMRTVEGLLLAPPLALLALRSARIHGWGRAGRLTLLALTGVLPPVMATGVVLARSGLSPWQWSAYPFWAPERFGSLDVTFSWRYAWIANPHIPAVVGSETVGQLRAYGLTFLGLTPPHGWAHFGTLWPALGWLALAGLVAAGVVAARRAGPTAGNAAGNALTVTVAVAGWCASHWLVFGAYFYPDPRFVLGALAWCPVALATALGALARASSARVRRAAWLASALIVALVIGDGWAHHPKRRLWEPKNEETRAAVERWLAADDQGRREETIPFDPVLAQALGLLPPERTRTIREWGALPATKQVNLLRRNGYLEGESARNDQNR